MGLPFAVQAFKVFVRVCARPARIALSPFVPPPCLPFILILLLSWRVDPDLPGASPFRLLNRSLVYSIPKSQLSVFLCSLSLSSGLGPFLSAPTGTRLLEPFLVAWSTDSHRTMARSRQTSSNTPLSPLLFFPYSAS